jgi:hypothetical protein
MKLKVAEVTAALSNSDTIYDLKIFRSGTPCALHIPHIADNVQCIIILMHQSLLVEIRE